MGRAQFNQVKRSIPARIKAIRTHGLLDAGGQQNGGVTAFTVKAEVYLSALRMQIWVLARAVGLIVKHCSH